MTFAILLRKRAILALSYSNITLLKCWLLWAHRADHTASQGQGCCTVMNQLLSIHHVLTYRRPVCRRKNSVQTQVNRTAYAKRSRCCTSSFVFLCSSLQQNGNYSSCLFLCEGRRHGGIWLSRKTSTTENPFQFAKCQHRITDI